jgi:hypothetical protein
MPRRQGGRPCARALRLTGALLLAGLLVPVAGAQASPGPAAPPVKCPSPRSATHVATAAQLTRALAHAHAGSTILLAQGVYAGHFVTRARGTATRPVTICGASGAILDGGTDRSGIVLLVKNAPYTHLLGLTVSDGSKGVVVDHSSHTVMTALTVHMTGQEGVHIQRFTVGAILRDSVVYDTGRRIARFGEGVYVGTAKANWCAVSGCKPDASDAALIERTTVGPSVRAEAIDVKEGTRGGRLSHNTFDGVGMTAARSWVDVKGDRWTIEDNAGRTTTDYGFTDSRVAAGWGNGNLFTGNTAYVPRSSAGFHVDPRTHGVRLDGNKVVTEPGLPGLL